MTGSDGQARQLAELIGDGHDPGTLPHRICLAGVRMVPVTGAAVSVSTGLGQVATVCASDDAAGRIEELQFTVGVGPCVDAVNSGGPVLVRDLADTTDPVGARWPMFASAAVQLGVRAVYAFPLTIGAIVLGALGLYRDSPGLLTEDELRRALFVADAAAFALLGLRAGAADGNPGTSGNGGSSADNPFDTRAFHRTEVYQATGMIMIQLGMNVENALVRLRAYAFAADRRIGDVARDVVARRLRLDADRFEADDA